MQGMCPCGSGKAAEACCNSLPSDDGGGGGPSLRRIVRDLQVKLERFSTRDRFLGDFDKAFSLFFDGTEEGEPPECESAVYRRFMDWLIHDFRFDHGHRLIELFEMEHAAALSAASRRLLSRWRSATRTVLQVIEEPTPQGFLARDLISGNVFHLAYSQPAQLLARWSIVIGRPISVDLRNWELPEFLAVLPPVMLRPLVQRLRGELRLLYHAYPGIGLQEGLRRVSGVFEELIRQGEASGPLAAYRTPEGDHLVPGRAIYASEWGREQIAAALEGAPELVPIEEGLYSVVRANDPSQPLGELRVVEGRRRWRIEIACLSEERLRATKAIVAKYLPGEQVAHRFDTQVHPAEYRLPSMSDDPPSGWRQPTPPRPRPVWQEVTERFYRAWAVTPLVEWGGRSPEQMTQLPAGRYRVEESLQALEHVEAIKATLGLPSDSLADVRKSLGLADARRPQYPPLRQEVPRWPHPQYAAVARQIKERLRGLGCSTFQIHAAYWLWYDYCLLESPIVRSAKLWAAAVVAALGRVESWGAAELRAVSEGERPQSVRERVMRMERSLGLRPYDRRYSVVVPEASTSLRDRQAEVLSVDLHETAFFEAVERMFALRQRVEAQTRSMSTLMDRAWNLYLSHVPTAGHDRLWAECFLDWFIFDWPIPVKGGRRAIELCHSTASRNGENCASDLEEWLGRHPHFCRIESEIDGVRGGNFSLLRLTDLVDPDKHFDILWPTMSQRIEKGDVVMLRPAPVSGIWIAIGQSLYFSSDQAEAIRASLEEEKELVERWYGRRITWDEFRSRHAERLYGVAYRLVEDVQEL